MKSVLISDIHFMNKSKYNPLMNEYDGILFPLVNLQLAYDTAKKENCDNVLILGDVIDKSSVSSYLAHKLITFFKDIDIETIIILGNHDISQVDKDFYSFITLLPDINSNIRVISKTEFLTNDIVCVPYSERKDIVTNEMIHDKILLTHIGISECKINESKKIPADFSLQYLRRYVRVITGHYHYPQEVENVLVVGSPWEIKKDEFEHSEKRIVVYDFDKLKYKSIPSIRKRLQEIYVQSITQLNKALDIISHSRNPYQVVKIDIPFQLPKELYERIERDFGSLVMINFVDEKQREIETISSLKELENIELESIDLKSMFLDYLATNLSSDEYQQIQEVVMEVLQNDT